MPPYIQSKDVHSVEEAEKEIKLAFESKVTGLYLNLNRLTEIPPSLGKLKELKTLQLANARANNLPETLSQLTQLEAVVNFEG